VRIAEMRDTVRPIDRNLYWHELSRCHCGVFSRELQLSPDEQFFQTRM
jgi:hypothetical protein